MLIKLDEILALAKDGAAIPAFNIYNLETVAGVTRAAERAKSPVILQVYCRLFDSDEGAFVAALALEAAKRAAVPVCFHLDHGAAEHQILRAIRFGCTGAMYDGSLLPFEENVAATADFVRLCRHAGMPMEGELGHIGATTDERTESYTEPGDARAFAARTGVAALAVSVGTAHGRYARQPALAIGRIAELREATGLPLVLHGGSGVPDDHIRGAMAAGIKKVNFATDLCYAFLDSVFETKRDQVAIDRFMQGPVDAVTRFAAEKIGLLGAGRARG